MSNPYTNLINFYKGVIGNIAGGNLTWSIYRPDYTAVDQTGVLIHSGVKLFVEPTTLNASNDRLRDVEFYTIGGNPTLFRSGDILIPSSSDFSVVTVSQVPDSQEFLAFQSSRLGAITDAQKSVVTSLRYDMAVAYNVGKDSHPEVEVSLTEAPRMAVIYSRSGIYEGMVFTDNDTGTFWEIVLVESFQKVTFVHLKKGNMSA